MTSLYLQKRLHLHTNRAVHRWPSKPAVGSIWRSGPRTERPVAFHWALLSPHWGWREILPRAEKLKLFIRTGISYGKTIFQTNLLLLFYIDRKNQLLSYILKNQDNITSLREKISMLQFQMLVIKLHQISNCSSVCIIQIY